jgi:hypothetical protein
MVAGLVPSLRMLHLSMSRLFNLRKTFHVRVAGSNNALMPLLATHTTALV